MSCNKFGSYSCLKCKISFCDDHARRKGWFILRQTPHSLDYKEAWHCERDSILWFLTLKVLSTTTLTRFHVRSVDTNAQKQKQSRCQVSWISLSLFQWVECSFWNAHYDEISHTVQRRLMNTDDSKLNMMWGGGVKKRIFNTYWIVSKKSWLFRMMIWVVTSAAWTSSHLRR